MLRENRIKNAQLKLQKAGKWKTKTGKNNKDNK